MIRRSALAAAGLALAALVLAPSARATVFTYEIFLSGPSENPPNSSPGTGNATVRYDDVAHTLDLQISFSGLTSPTTVSHFHAVTATSGRGDEQDAALVENVGVATSVPTLPGFPAGVTSGTYDNVLDLTDPASWNPDFVMAQGGVAQAEAAFAAALDTGRTYWNVHTDAFPLGEIRGFPEPVPAPGVAGLLALGLSAFVARARDRR
jgi:hypothetical protein